MTSDETVVEVCDETLHEKGPLDEPNMTFNDTSVTDVDKTVVKFVITFMVKK